MRHSGKIFGGMVKKIYNIEYYYYILGSPFYQFCTIIDGTVVQIMTPKTVNRANFGGANGYLGYLAQP